VPEWTWNAAKDAANRRKHGLSLARGVLVLDGDPLALLQPDPHRDGDRWRTIGSAAGFTVLVVVHTEGVMQASGIEVGRIISVRTATRQERRAYEQGIY
jgi:uncharacterized DUF497 family protein